MRAHAGGRGFESRRPRNCLPTSFFKVTPEACSHGSSSGPRPLLIVAEWLCGASIARHATKPALGETRRQVNLATAELALLLKYLMNERHRD